MKMCQMHWNEMIQAVDDRGMTRLVAKDGKDALEMTKRQVNGTDSPFDFDPLMQANWAISGMAMKCGGLYLMGLKEDGTHYCPLCEVEANGGEPGRAKVWIDSCMDHILKEAKEKGLA